MEIRVTAANPDFFCLPRPCRQFLCFHKRNIYQVLAQEPDLHFIGPQDVADDHVVGAIVPQF